VSLSTLRVARFPISILISALVLVGLLLFPGPAFGVQTVTTAVSGASFNLGSPVPGTVTIDLEADEFIGLATPNKATVSLDITGPQAVSFALPLDAGPFSIDSNGSSLTGTISHDNRVTTNTFAGYGYGYKAGSTGGTITVTFNFTHRILLDPAPPILPQLPAAQDRTILNLAGAQAAQGGPSAGKGIQAFPDFGFVGNASAPGVPFSSEARALDSRPGGSVAILGVILDGNSGDNDVYAEFEVGADDFGPFVFPRTSFTLPNVSGFDMAALQGLAFVSSTRIAVSGGVDGAGNDAFVAVLDLTGGPPATGASLVDAAGLGGGGGLGLFDKATGGVEFDGSKILVAEFQSDPSGQVTVAKLDPTNLSTGAISFDTPLGFAGAGGFDALGGDPNSGSPITRFFGVTEPPHFGSGPEDVRILEFDATGGPLGTHFPTGLPSGQAITGAGLIDNPTDSGNSALMFIITKNTKEVMVSAVAGAAAGPKGGQFTNEPQAVDYDSANDRYFVPVKGAPNSHLAILDGSFNEVDRYELTAGGGLGEIGGAVYDNTDNSYWVVDANFPPTISKIDPDNNGAVLDSITLPFFVGEVGALASYYDTGTDAGSSADDTLFLYAYEVFSDVFYKINTSTQQVVNTINVFDNDFSDNFFPPFGATGATYTSINGVDRLVISRFNQVFTVDPMSGALYKGFNVAASELTGLGNGSLLMADRGFGGSKIMASRLPGEVVAETSTVGSYTMSTTVDNTASGSAGEFGPSVTSSGIAFALTKLSEVTITVTTPTDGQAFTATPVSVQGTVDDRTVAQITVSAGLASGTIAGEDLDGPNNATLSPSGPSTFSDADDVAQYSTSGNNNLWHSTANLPQMLNTSGSAIAATSNTAFYYGQGENSAGSGNPNYNTGFGPGGVNFGDLDSATVTVDGTGTNLDFDIWYATEPTPPGNLTNVFDRKQVQFCDFNGGCQNLFHIVSFVQEQGGFGGGFGGGGGGFVFEPPPGFLPPGVQIGQTFNFEGQTAMFIPRERGGFLNGGGAQFSHVTYNLDSLVGQTGFIRIKFHTQDDFNDSFEQQGVIVDNFEVTGPLTTGETFAVTGGAFNFNLGIAEGSNSTTLIAKSTVPGTGDGTATFTTILDTSAPTLTINAVTSPTTFISQTLTGTFVELSPSQLVVKVGGATKVIQKTFTSGATTYSHTVGLAEGANAISLTLTDTSNQSATVNATITVDNTGPVISASFRPILSDVGVRAADDFFITAAVNDAATGVASVEIKLPAGSQLSLSNTSLAALSQVPDVIVKKHELGRFTATGATATTDSTHVGMTAFGTGTPAGVQQIIVDATDGAGNVSTASFNVSVVASLNNRSAYLSKGSNFIGFPLIPTATAVADILNQFITNVDPALTAAMNSSSAARNVKLSDVIDVVWSYSNDANDTLDAFTSFRPDGQGTPSFVELNAFDGMIVVVNSSITVDSVEYAVFDTGTVLGSRVDVPIKWNVPGVFVQSGASLPPGKAMRSGWNVWTPHAINPGLFENPGFLRAAVVTPPGNLAVSAITLVNSIDAIADSTAPGGFDAAVESGFTSSGPGDTLSLMRSYWTFMVGDATITP
jgi:hypothetical protein